MAVERRTAGSARRVLVIGCIHGDEVAGVQIVAVLGRQRLTQPADLVLVKTVNPDGQRLHRRQNANGVDLNRNFPYRWRPLGVRGDQQYSGPKPLSEPEARAVVALIRALRPVVTVWFHEPVDVVDESGGDVSVEHEFASLVGQRLRRLSRYPGSVASWQDTTFPGTTAFVDELPRGGPADISSWVRAVESLSYRRG